MEFDVTLMLYSVLKSGNIMSDCVLYKLRNTYTTSSSVTSQAWILSFKFALSHQKKFCNHMKEIVQRLISRQYVFLLAHK